MCPGQESVESSTIRSRDCWWWTGLFLAVRNRPNHNVMQAQAPGDLRQIYGTPGPIVDRGRGVGRRGACELKIDRGQGSCPRPQDHRFRRAMVDLPQSKEVAWLTGKDRVYIENETKYSERIHLLSTRVRYLILNYMFVSKNQMVVGNGDLYGKIRVTSGYLITSQSYSSGICGPWRGTLRILKALPQRLHMCDGLSLLNT